LNAVAITATPCDQGQKMQRQHLCPINGTKRTHLFGEPITEEAEDFGRAALRGVVQFGEFRAKRSDLLNTQRLLTRLNY
jgi:hypothetical protein